MRRSPATFTTIMATTGSMTNSRPNVYGYSIGSQVSVVRVRVPLAYGAVYNSGLSFGV